MGVPFSGHRERESAAKQKKFRGPLYLLSQTIVWGENTVMGRNKILRVFFEFQDEFSKPE